MWPGRTTSDLPSSSSGMRIGGHCVELIPLEEGVLVKGVHPTVPFHGFAQPTFSVESLGNFSSVVANVGLLQGRWYYECTIRKCSLTMQLGHDATFGLALS
jgi:hypothetical protein